MTRRQTITLKILFAGVICIVLAINLNTKAGALHTVTPPVCSTCFADSEKKVDYLEQLYFSGLNKDALCTRILITIQAMEEKPENKSIAKQYVFLSGIKDKANAADNSCQVEEMLAAGIYDIDALEALNQNITKPSSATTDKISGALTSVSDLSSSAGNLNSSVFTLRAGTCTSYRNYAAASNSYNKMAASTAVLGNAANTAGKAKDMYDKAGVVLKYFHKDKPCKSVPQKSIEIGVHIVPDMNTAVDK
jgi:hypothetical protein